ncbi:MULTISPECIES: hypothetical protein [unclassified Frondihabitans]|nr:MULTISPECIES: hypothetical protein [unclassified Frondihabitans]
MRRHKKNPYGPPRQPGTPRVIYVAVAILAVATITLVVLAALHG